MDTSQVGLGAVLIQRLKVEGKEFFIYVSYASKSFKGANRQ